MAAFNMHRCIYMRVLPSVHSMGGECVNLCLHVLDVLI